jgi:hypothetical protein
MNRPGCTCRRGGRRGRHSVTQVERRVIGTFIKLRTSLEFVASVLVVTNASAQTLVIVRCRRVS